MCESGALFSQRDVRSDGSAAGTVLNDDTDDGTHSFAEDADDRDDIVESDTLEDSRGSVQTTENRGQGGNVEPYQKHPAYPGDLKDDALVLTFSTKCMNTQALLL